MRSRQSPLPSKPESLLRHWPQVPLGLLLALIGFLNLFHEHLPQRLLSHYDALKSLAGSFSAVGATAQSLLSAMMVVTGIALFWRVVSAWVIAVLLLAIGVGLMAARQAWGIGFVLQAAMLVLLLFFRRRFSRRTAAARVVLSMSGILAVLAYGTFGSFLLGESFSPPVHDLGTAFYFTIATLSTVGYGGVPVTPEGRWFVISLLVVGLSVFAGAFASAIGPKIAKEMSRLFDPKKKAMELKNHVILVGRGLVARSAAEEFTRRGLGLVQIVATGTPAEATAASHRIIVGDATADDILKEAGIQSARMIVAATEDDGENAFIVLSAKEQKPGLRALAVANSAQSTRRLKLAHADLVFSPVAVGARVLADLVEGGAIASEFQDLLHG
ncbi:MAG TPA: NAD-binding protein [Opitutaceae bacterium]|jgi:voltage-gated potassium channel